MQSQIFDGFSLKTKEFLPELCESFWSEMSLGQFQICQSSKAVDLAEAEIYPSIKYKKNLKTIHLYEQKTLKI